MKYLRQSAILASLQIGSATADVIEIPQTYINVARVNGIPAKVLYAVALSESRRKVGDQVIAWPWTINVHGEGVYFSTKAQMRDRIAAELFRGNKRIDIGAMQVNIRYHSKRFDDLDTAITPEVNINVASEILIEQFLLCDLDWWCAVGKYHSPNNEARAAKYRARVRRWYERL